MRVSVQDLIKQKELTYLELPPDVQKVTKRPDTNVISDKDRTASSRTPLLDAKQLKKIIDSSRPGRPRTGWSASRAARAVRFRPLRLAHLPRSGSRSGATPARPDSESNFSSCSRR